MPHDRKQVRRGEPRDTQEQRNAAVGRRGGHEEKRGPSTNVDPVPDGLEGSILEDDERGTRRSSTRAGRGRVATPPPRGDDQADGSVAPDAGATTSKQHGDREEGRDRTVHDL